MKTDLHHENQPGTIKNHKTPPGTMKNQHGTMKIQGTMKNQSGTIFATFFCISATSTLRLNGTPKN